MRFYEFGILKELKKLVVRYAWLGSTRLDCEVYIGEEKTLKCCFDHAQTLLFQLMRLKLVLIFELLLNITKSFYVGHS